MQGTLLTYASKRYLWGGVIGAVALLLSYFYYARTTIPSGGTVWGLVYGWIGLIAILVLMFLGIRKRWYSSRLGTLEGWTSARVYLARAPWLVNVPGAAILVTVLGLNLLGNALRDVLDPRLR